MIGIYRYTNRINGKSYIGKSTNIEQRKNGHLRKTKNGDTAYFHNALRKYGEQNFDFEILELCQESELDERERYYIEHFNTTMPNWYNMTVGGDGGNMFDVRTAEQQEETRRKMSESHKGLKHTAEEKEKISLAKKGKPRLYARGVRAWNRGMKMPEDFGQKSRRVGRENGMFGKTQSDLCRETNARIHKGQTPANKGKHLVWDNPEHTKHHYE